MHKVQEYQPVTLSSKRTNPQRKHTHLDTAFAVILGPTDPHPITVHVEPFFPSAFKDLTWMFATTTKICTSDGSSSAHAVNLQRTSLQPSYTLTLVYQGRVNGGV